MSVPSKEKASPIMVIVAFAIVYLVWGSTYFFIQEAVQTIPPMTLGAIRFIISGTLLMIWCLIKGERLATWQQLKTAIFTGLLLLLVGNGAVIWAEKSIPSSLAAIFVSSAPIWFVMLDKPRWRENLTSRSVVLGLIFGFIGVILLFSGEAVKAITSSGEHYELIGFFILFIGTLSWAGGSIYSKYHSKGSTTAASAWQMLAAGIAFSLFSLISKEWSAFDLHTVTMASWLSLAYLVIMGSLVGFSAYVWLLKVRPVTQVSTYAYVNPLVAVLLGVIFAGEHLSLLQFGGFIVILSSVFLINIAKYRNDKKRLKKM